MVEDRSHTGAVGFSSWAPDYSRLPQPIPLVGSVRVPQLTRWKACGNLKWDPPTDSGEFRGGLLPVDIIEIDVISSDVATMEEVEDGHLLSSIIDFAASLPRTPYFTSCSQPEAVWRSLIADTYLSRPATKEVETAFRDFITFSVWKLEDAAKRASDLTGLPEEVLLKLTQWKVAQPEDTAIPSPSDVIKRPSSQQEQELIQTDWKTFSASLSQTYAGRRLFRTKHGYIGIGPAACKIGDLVCIIAGATVPMIIRPLQSGYYAHVGESYVHGYMDGIAVRWLGKGESFERSKLRRVWLE